MNGEKEFMWRYVGSCRSFGIKTPTLLLLDAWSFLRPEIMAFMILSNWEVNGYPGISYSQLRWLEYEVTM